MIHYNTKIIEEMIERKDSYLRKHFMKKTFLKAIHAFYSILHIIDNTRDLSKFKYLNYKKGVKNSSVLISTAKTQGTLLFTEDEFGKNISIYDLI